jgi:hypothetical protein
MASLADVKQALHAVQLLRDEYKAVADRKLPVDLRAAKSADWKPGGGVEGSAMDFYSDDDKKADRQKAMRCYTACANLLTLENQLVQAFVNNPGGIIYDDFKKLRGFGKAAAKVAVPFGKLTLLIAKTVEKTPILKTIRALSKGEDVLQEDLIGALLHPKDAITAAKEIYTAARSVTYISGAFYFLGSVVKKFGVGPFRQKVSSVAEITEYSIVKLRSKALSQFANSRRVAWKASRKNQ